MEIKTIDLWTEQHANHQNCFNGAFIDGVNEQSLPYDKIKIVRNCNCIITNNENLPIANKHNAIVFYTEGRPVRLVVLEHDTDVDNCIKIALRQHISGGGTLKERLIKENVMLEEIDLKQEKVFNIYEGHEQIDVGSCDRPSLLNAMLKGSYTEDDTDYGVIMPANFYEYDSNLQITYSLETGSEQFTIEHCGGFKNEDGGQIIPIQKDGSITSVDIKKALKEGEDE